jgi:hypothetical protein
MSDIKVPRPVQALLDAINSADIGAFVASFAPDAMINEHGQVVSGEEAMRAWAATEVIGVGARVSLVEAGTSDATTHLVCDWTTRLCKGRSEAFITVRDGLVSEFRIPAP